MRYIKQFGKPGDGFMMWELWQHRYHKPIPNTASPAAIGQYLCQHAPLSGDASAIIPTLPKRTYRASAQSIGEVKHRRKEVLFSQTKNSYYFVKVGVC